MKFKNRVITAYSLFAISLITLTLLVGGLVKIPYWLIKPLGWTAIGGFIWMVGEFIVDKISDKE